MNTHSYEEDIMKKYIIENLSCASCAAKIEELINQLPSVERASVNFANSSLYLEAKDYGPELLEQVQKSIQQVDEDGRLVEPVKGHKYSYQVSGLG